MDIGKIKPNLREHGNVVLLLCVESLNRIFKGENINIRGMLILAFLPLKK